MASQEPKTIWQVGWSALRRAPVTLVLAAASLAIYLVPGASSLLQYDVSCTLSGEWWRVLTGHLTHWSANHLAWDLAVFLGLGLLCEPRIPRGTWITIAGSAVLICFLCPAFYSLDTYRGLSGIDTGLFALMGTTLFVERAREGDWPVTLLLGALLAAMIGKIGYEFLTGECLFVDVDAGGFVPLPLAHLVGAVVGMAVVVGDCMWRRDENRQPCPG